MSDLYDATREVRDAVYLLNQNTRDGLQDVALELRRMVAALRDISDVLHAKYYGHPTRDEEDASDDTE